MSYEIGSHFELDTNVLRDNLDNIDWLPDLGDSVLTFSGRNAIEIAIRDIRQTSEVQTVYMPSYHCDSMSQPFIENGFDIVFYEVEYNEKLGLVYKIDPDTECDTFFAMSYFGLGEAQLDPIIESFTARGKIVIEDVTHRLLQEDSHSRSSHYAIASLRKGFAIPTGGYVTKRDGAFYENPNQNSDTFVEGKLTAMQAKQEYLQGADVDKDAFLEQFTNFERKLKAVDYTYKIDSASLDLLKKQDIENIRMKRRKNAAVLYEGIKKYDMLKPLIPNPDFTKDCPLFVPIMLPNTDVRNDLRKKLIEHNIYCPVHWPQENSVNTIWEHELSLICDQRYTEEDMKYILSIIEEWHHKQATSY